MYLKWIFDLATQLLSFMNSDVANKFFSDPFISTALSYFYWFGGIIFVFSVLTVVFNVSECKASGDFVNYPMICKDIGTGFILWQFSQPLVKWAFVLSVRVTYSVLSASALSIAIPHSSSLNLWNYLQFSVIDMFMSIYTTCIIFAMFFQLMKRFGIFFIQVVLGYFYIADVVKGNQGGAGEWLRDIVAGTLTFFLQMLFFYGGMAIINVNETQGIQGCWVGLILLTTAPAVPMILKKFGYSTGSGHSAAGLSRMMSGTVSALSRI